MQGKIVEEVRSLRRKQWTLIDGQSKQELTSEHHLKLKKKQHSIIEKGLWEKTKALYSTPLRRQTQEQGEQQARKEDNLSSVLWIASNWVRLYLSREEKEILQLQHIVAVHLLLRNSAPESYFLNRISYFEMLGRYEDPEKRETWAIRNGWEYSSLARIIKQIKVKTCLSLGD